MMKKKVFQKLLAVTLGAVHAPVAHGLGERGHAHGKGLALGSLHQRHQGPGRADHRVELSIQARLYHPQ